MSYPRNIAWRLAFIAAFGLVAACGSASSSKASQDLDGAVADSLPIDAPDLADSIQDLSVAASDAAALADAVTLADAATALAADATEVIDTVADSPDSADSADAVVDAGPQTCFYGGPPAADAWVANVEAPAAPCSETAPPEWFDGQPLPKPTLDLKVGWRDAAGLWHPYNNGDWVPLLTAQQGGFHVELVPVVILPGQTAATTPLQVQSFTLAGCNSIGVAPTNNSIFVQTTGPDGEYTLDPAKQVLTVFGVTIASIDKYCGIWVHVYWRVRIKDTNQWGEAVRLLRTYNATVPTNKG